MQKRGKWILLISISLVVILVGLLFYYFTSVRTGCEKCYDEKVSSGELINPVSGLSNEQAVAQFNEAFVLYLLYSIKAYNLHNVPLSSSYPIIEILVDEDSYTAIVQDGIISVEKRATDKKDIIIKTTREEGVKMLRDWSYIEKSFRDGLSGIELVEGKTTLFAKGYLNLYEDLTGKGVSGSTVDVYTK